MSDVPALIDQLIAEGHLDGAAIRGCTDEQVNEVMLAQGVSRLPSGYLSFLRRLGQGAGDLNRGTDWLYPRLLKLRQWTNGLFDENRIADPLGPDAFVISMHQGYIVHWLSSVRLEDPQVWGWSESAGSPPKADFENFYGFFADIARRP